MLYLNRIYEGTEQIRTINGEELTMELRERPEYDLKIIGRNLRRLREAKHLTAQQVRDYLRLGSVQAVYKYERGLSYPQTDAMFALMELYGASLRDIVDDHTFCIEWTDMVFLICRRGYPAFFVETDDRGESIYSRSARMWQYYYSWQKKG